MYSSLDEIRYEKIRIRYDATLTNTLVQHLDERSVSRRRTHNQNEEVVASTDINTTVRYDDFHPRHVAV